MTISCWRGERIVRFDLKFVNRYISMTIIAKIMTYSRNFFKHNQSYNGGFFKEFFSRFVDFFEDNLSYYGELSKDFFEIIVRFGLNFVLFYTLRHTVV